jgi:hypothetical protein
MDRQPLRDTDSFARASSTRFFQDENNCAASSFQELSQAFSQRITELQQLMCLRIEGGSQVSLRTPHPGTRGSCQPPGGAPAAHLMLSCFRNTAMHRRAYADHAKHLFVADLQGLEVRLAYIHSAAL